MDQANVTALLMTINQMQMFLPPYLFTQLVNNPALKVLEMVANGHVELQAQRPAPAETTTGELASGTVSPPRANGPDAEPAAT
jgi:hypothetical protein